MLKFILCMLLLAGVLCCAVGFLRISAAAGYNDSTVPAIFSADPNTPPPAAKPAKR